MPLKFAKPVSRAEEKQASKAERLARARIIFRLVSKRDKNTCRVPGCGKRGPGLHHHHLRFRSRGGEDETKNIFLVCAQHHSDLHGYRMTVDGLDADHTLRFVRSK